VRKLIVDYSLCNGCGRCEIVCSKAFFKEENREKSAIRIFSNQYGGYHGQYRLAVCDQCGVCAKMCTPMALYVDDNGVWKIDKNKCVGCLICIGECDRGLIYYHDDLPTPFKCIACGLCVRACPTGALRLSE